MKKDYRLKIIENELENAKRSHAGLKPGFNLGEFYASKFNACWRAFDAYLNFKFNCDVVQTRLDEFKRKYRDWYKHSYFSFSDRFRTAVTTLSEYQVEDMRHKPKPPITISDRTDLDEIIEVIYRVRCNLEHGGKLMTEDKNVILVENSGDVLYELMERIMAEFEKM